MIPDWETNHLFLSDRLEDTFPALVASLRSVLTGVTIDTIADTSDIWCRDYMPIQLDEGRFCQFVYDPDYLREHQHLITPPDKCQLSFMVDCGQEPLVLDGGNVVASRTRVILTDKIYKENSSIERPRLRSGLEDIFQAECILIPKEPYDMVGHSDGVVRFVAEDRVLINDYSAVDPGYGTRLRNVLEEKGLEVETLPMFQEKARRQPGDLHSAVGLYINYLRVGDVVVLPAYDMPEDEAALKRVRDVMPDARVLQLPCRDLAEKGGVLNCVSWTIKARR
ncbi:MAG: agmatine deiminase family protein [Planctomycetes bacterium]|nr:agmatine deiminase family protein [Planctomycetota bacterium]